MIATLLKFLVGGIGAYICGRLLWRFFLKYRANRFNKAALVFVDNQLKKLLKKLDKTDAQAALQLAKMRQKKRDIDKLVNLYEDKLKNDN